MDNSTQRYEVPHKCIQVSEEDFLGSMYTKTAAALFVAHPTERASLAQGFVLVGPGVEPAPTGAQHGQKYLWPRRHTTY